MLAQTRLQLLGNAYSGLVSAVQAMYITGQIAWAPSRHRHVSHSGKKGMQQWLPQEGTGAPNMEIIRRLKGGMLLGPGDIISSRSEVQVCWRKRMHVHVPIS